MSEICIENEFLVLKSCSRLGLTSFSLKKELNVNLVNYNQKKSPRHCLGDQLFQEISLISRNN